YAKSEEKRRGEYVRFHVARGKVKENIRIISARLRINDIKSLTSKSDGVTYCAPRETLFVKKVVHSHNEMWASFSQIVCGCLQVAGRKVMQA
ncbi:hypothetical protein AB9C30_27865, partial [Klebsiella pneumoniae]|uniref:hypothetical protein n=1 Tax=Klebsiella pneumoniae TaxID=573 RepID=UPI00350FC12B